MYYSIGPGLGPTSLRDDDVDLCWDDSDDGDVWENSIARVRRQRTRGRTGRARVVGSIMAYAVVYRSETGDGDG